MSSPHDARDDGSRAKNDDASSASAVRAHAAGGLTHPLAIGSVLLLLLNDHVLKHAHPSWWTGKLSDVAGLVFFPLLLEAIVELALAATHRYKHPSRMLNIVTIVITAIGFSWVKTTASGHAAYALVGGVARWPFEAISAWISGSSAPPLARARGVIDASDLLALFALLGALHVGHTRRSPT